MAAFSRLPSGLWRAQVARNGARRSASFATKSAAQQWAVKIEAELMAHKRGTLPRKTVAEALQKYRDEVSPYKRGERWETVRLNALLREDWAALWLVDLNAPILARWRDRRLLGVTKGTVQRDVNLLRAVFTRAREEWKWLERSPFDGFTNPGDNKARTRRVGWREIRAICRKLGYPGESKSSEVALAFLLSLRTAMRAGELMSLTPAAVNLHTRIAHLKDTKNGDDRAVPLSRAAVRLFTGWKGWTVDNASRGVLFCKACRRVKIKNLHFHDARAEALTLMARRGIDILTLARISGHRDINMLQRYYRETTEAIALRLG